MFPEHNQQDRSYQWFDTAEETEQSKELRKVV